MEKHLNELSHLILQQLFLTESGRVPCREIHNAEHFYSPVAHPVRTRSEFVWSQPLKCFSRQGAGEKTINWKSSPGIYLNGFALLKQGSQPGRYDICQACM